jgi:uroporphyrinogen decarboxylase
VTSPEPAAAKRDRVQATLRGQGTDRPPISFWHHFPCDAAGGPLGRQGAAFAARYDLDIAKVMPDIPYPVPRTSITKTEDLLCFDRWSCAGLSRFTSAYLTAVRIMRGTLGADYPLVATVYAPLTSVMHAAGGPDRLLELAAQAPELVHTALANTSANLRHHVTELIGAGVDGIYLSVQGAGADSMTSAQFREFGRPYDLPLLRAAADGWLNVVHVHGDRSLNLSEVDDYPVHAVSWSDRISHQPLDSYPGRGTRALMGGLDERLAGAATEHRAELLAQAHSAVAQIGPGLILAPGCSVPDGTAAVHLDLLRDLARQVASVAR